MRFEEYGGQRAAQQQFLQLVQGGRMPHALLVRGPEGAAPLGFVQAALQRLACEHPTETDSCGHCNGCRQAAALQHPDQIWLFPYFSQIKDGRPATTEDFLAAFQEAAAGTLDFGPADWAAALDAENKQLAIPVHEIRNLRRSLSLARGGRGYRCVVLWQAELLRPEAANALLKVLEEPPERTLFFLLVEGEGALLPTIVSRCQQLRLARWSVQELATLLPRLLEVPESHARELAQIADGSLYRAVAIARQSDAALHETFVQWMRRCHSGNLTELIQWTQEINRQPKEYHKLLLTYGLGRIRDALLFACGVPQLAAVAGVQREFVRKFAAVQTFESLEQVAEALEDLLTEIGQNANTQAAFFNASYRLMKSFQQARQAVSR